MSWLFSLGATMPYRVFWNRRRMRWALGADDIVFIMRRHQVFFTLGKTIPVTRGDGVYQQPMDFALEQINQGGWVHIFPEGLHGNKLIQTHRSYHSRKSKSNKRINEIKMG